MEKRLIKGYKYDYYIDAEWYFYNSKWWKTLWNIASTWYKQISMCKKTKKVNVYIHRLVWKMFIPNPYKKKEINHIDGDKANNHYLNLERVTRSENEVHKRKWRKQSEYSKLMSSKANSKKVYRYDNNWNLLDSYDSLVKASKLTWISINTLWYKVRSQNEKTRSYLPEWQSWFDV